MSNSGLPENRLVLKRTPIARDDCGMAAAADIIGDRWSLLILRAVSYGVRRFDDLKADLEISSATLTNRLQALVAAGLLQASPYRDGNARRRKEYLLTDAGEDLRMVLMVMMDWADRNVRKAPSKLKTVSRVTGEELRLAYVDSEGRAVDQADLDFALVP